MKIVVCIKQVPNTTEIKIDPITNTLKRDGVPSIINPDAECERFGKNFVWIISSKM